MTAIMPRGWCPTLFAPMASGDGLLVRIRPPGSVLGVGAARALAAAARRYGNGVIELTNRASLQVRGLRAETVAPFASEIVAAGLADPDPAAERRRKVIAPPLAGDDPSANRHAHELVRALENVLVYDRRLATLPDKFCLLVDAGGVLPIAAASADIRVILPVPTPFPQGEKAFLLADGCDLAATCDPAEGVARLASAFLTLARARHHHRMRALIADVGANTVFAAAGLSATARVALQPTPNSFGWLRYPGTDRGAFGVGLPFGATDSFVLSALADSAEKFGDGTLRLTPWRTFAIPSVTSPATVSAIAETLALITTQHDPRARISACPAQPACASATVPTRDDAAHIAATAYPGSVHVSGCAKGCAHRDVADLTLVGEGGRYAIVRHGRAGDPPARTGLALDDVLQEIHAVRQGVLG